MQRPGVRPPVTDAIGDERVSFPSMATMVCFHAHPDDECIITGGVMAKAASEGHRVVLVVATKGENGEVPEGFLGAEELLCLVMPLRLPDAG